MNIKQLNSIDSAAFVDILKDIFEHSAWVAEQAVTARPFKDVNALHEKMSAVVANADEAAKLQLLKAHPELAGREAQSGGLTASSTSEQVSAKLDALSASEMEKITKLNLDYTHKFGFPFIIAVLNHTKESIFSEFEKRLENSREAEIETALQQVYLIAQFRLAALTSSNSP